MRLFNTKKRLFDTPASSTHTSVQNNDSCQGVLNWRFLLLNRRMCWTDAFFISSSFIFYIKVFILQLYFSTSICKWIFNQFKPRAVSTGASVNLSSQCNFGVKINGPSGSFASLAVKFFDRFWNEHFLWSHRNWRKEIEVWVFVWFW